MYRKSGKSGNCQGNPFPNKYVREKGYLSGKCLGNPFFRFGRHPGERAPQISSVDY